MTSASVPAGGPKSTMGRRFAWIGRRLLPIGLFFAAAIGLLGLIGLAQRFGWIQAPGDTSATARTEAGAVYTCPMHPQIRQPTPGRCPICGMELVPAASGAANLDEFAVKIEPAQRRLANIQTEPVERGPLEAILQTVGSIAIDESRQATIAAYIDGRLERLFADYTGVEIKKGDHLAVIYSPQLYGSQVEYLEARKAIRSADGLPVIRQAQEALAANTRLRLHEFGMTDEQLAELERSGKAESRLTIYAPQGGTVVEKLAVEGNYVEAGDPIYRIAELSTVWLMLRLFPEDATRIRFGQAAEAEVRSLPGETLIGRVAFIDPTVDLQTRTVGVRVELSNFDRRLRPGDYATARIRVPLGTQGEIFDASLANKWISPMHPQIVRDEPGQCPICGMDLVPTARYGFAKEPIPQPESLYVPRPAVLLAGSNSVVYVETRPGLFEIRPVKLGPILRDKIVILEGVVAGEQVATAGNFLIDSQMQLAGKPSLIDPTRALARQKPAPGPLQLDVNAVATLTGPAATKFDALLAAYLQVQQALAGDQPPPADAAQALHHAAGGLARAEGIPEPAKPLARDIEQHAEHLSHLDLAGVRKAFKPISHAVLRLAAQVRTESAQKPFIHFYCPMVAGGGGDWLQATEQLLNPYFGSQMLRCGEKVQVVPAVRPAASPPDDPDAEGQAATKKAGE
jgi:Cu(I)/Ag(I) efflux system membrane fusion protein